MTANYIRKLLAPILILSVGAISDKAPRSESEAKYFDQSSTARVLDSAGVRIVEYPALAPKEPWFVGRSSFVLDAWSRVGDAFHIERNAFRDIGGEDAAVELKDPFFAAAVELPNGQLMVSDKDRLVRIDGTGRVLGSSGRAGRGPGEFTDIRSMCVLAGDTVLVIDKLGTVSLWDGRGDHIRTMAGRDPFRWSSCDGRGHLVSTSRPLLVRIDPDGVERRTEHWLTRPSGVRTMSLGRLPATVMAGLLSWEPSLAWTRNELVVANGRRYELQWRYSDGRVRQIMRLSRPVEKISDAEWKKLVSDAVPAGSGAANRDLVLQAMGPKPNAAFPAHGSILVDPERRVWVADFANTSSLTVFAHDGSLLGRVQLRSAPGSPRPALVGVGANHIQVREQDEDGFIHLRFYRLRSRR